MYISSKVFALFLRKANEDGDIDKQTEAQQRLAALAADASGLERANKEREATKPVEAEQAPTTETPTYEQPQYPDPDPKAETWAEDNQWFGQDRAMTMTSFAIHQDFTGNARDRVIALGIGVGSGYLFETTFKKEVYSDLTGERGTLMGAIQGLFAAQYSILRKKGHSPSEAFNETVEEATQSLYPLVAENGMDWMYANCSTTAQRGALDWWKKFRDAVYPVFEDLYNSVESGEEARITIKANKKSNYREGLDKELAELKDSELWKTGSEVRKLRP